MHHSKKSDGMNSPLLQAPVCPRPSSLWLLFVPKLLWHSPQWAEISSSQFPSRSGTFPEVLLCASLGTGLHVFPLRAVGLAPPLHHLGLR